MTGRWDLGYIQKGSWEQKECKHKLMRMCVELWVLQKGAAGEGRTGWQTCWNDMSPAQAVMLYSRYEGYMVCMVGRDAATYLHLSAPSWTHRNSNKKVSWLPWNNGAASVHGAVRRSPRQPPSAVCWERSSHSFPTWLYCLWDKREG